MNINTQMKISDVITNGAIGGGGLFFAFIALTFGLFGPVFFIASVVLLITGQDFNGITPLGAFAMACGLSLCSAMYSKLGKSILRG